MKVYLLIHEWETNDDEEAGTYVTYVTASVEIAKALYLTTGQDAVPWERIYAHDEENWRIVLEKSTWLTSDYPRWHETWEIRPYTVHESA